MAASSPQCLFVGSEADDVVTCDENNTAISVWTSPVASEPRLLQTLKFESDADTWFDVCIDDTGEFVSVCDCKNPVMYVVHLSKSPGEVRICEERSDELRRKYYV